MFEKIGVMGRVAYAAYCLECFLKQQAYNLDDWKQQLDTLWSFSDDKLLDRYIDKVLECLPEVLFDPREDFTNSEFFTEQELMPQKKLYVLCPDFLTVECAVNTIYNMVASNLYGGIVPPEPFSLGLMENEFLPVFRKKLMSLPPIEPFAVYSIN